MKQVIKLLDFLEQNRVSTRLTLFMSTLFLFACSMAANYVPNGIQVSNPIDAAGVALLLGLLWAQQSGKGHPSFITFGCHALSILGKASLLAVFAVNLDHLPEVLTPYQTHIIDPEIALSIIISTRAILKAEREPLFARLSRYTICAVIPAFGILSTVSGMAGELQTNIWQPTTGINLPLAIMLLFSALVEIAHMPQSRNARMLGIALPLPAITYFILTDLFTKISTGTLAGLILDLFILATLIIGARFLTSAVDVFFTMADNAEKRSAMMARQSNVIQDLVYALAHDLRSPARGIVQTAEWLREDLRSKDYEALEARNEVISERAQALYERLDAFVEYVRLGRFVAKRQAVALDLLAENLVDAMPHETKKIITLHGHELTIQTDESALASILSNLLENAATYADEEAPEIRLAWETEGEDLTISVYNNGPSIREGAIPKLFQPFRGNVSNTVQNGMALAITARLVEALGGTIAVLTDKENGKGTEFRCEFPLRYAAAAQNTA